MAFYQEPPRLPHPLHDDRLLKSYLKRAIPEPIRNEIWPSLESLAELSRGPLLELMMQDRLSEPRLVAWDPWGHRTDRIELTATWQNAQKLAAQYGLVGTAYDKKYGPHARSLQAALIYLFHPSTDVYTCPLAMTDGAAKTLLSHKNQPLIDRALAHLTSRDPAQAWTSGQWMTERTGGSDVGISETVARPEGDGRYRLYGTKWFTSAATSEIALTLARPEGNGPGGRGLALFYLETRDDSGKPNGILVNRLKDKLGTRKLPTAELTLDGTLAVPVTGLSDGIRAIAPMLNVTRYWNAVCSIATMNRGLAFARDYARRRVAFGGPLSERPLHIDTLAGQCAEFEAAFHLTMFTAELLGLDESGQGSEDDARLLRVVTPLTKLLTAKQAVAVTSEVLEAFGGAGYVEDTGIPMLLRDVQVLAIWEGTTNVLSLDVLRAVGKEGALEPLLAVIKRLCGTAKDPLLIELGDDAIRAAASAASWLVETGTRDLASVEAGARRFALTLARSLALATLIRHAQWSLENERDATPRAAARRFARHGIDLLDMGSEMDEARALFGDLGDLGDH